jgi:hypothetical protein
MAHKIEMVAAMINQRLFEDMPFLLCGVNAKAARAGLSLSLRARRA